MLREAKTPQQVAQVRLLGELEEAAYVARMAAEAMETRIDTAPTEELDALYEELDHKLMPAFYAATTAVLTQQRAMEW